MDHNILKDYAEYSAIATLFIIAFWSKFKSFYSTVKSFITKTPTPSGNTTTVNINTNPVECIQPIDTIINRESQILYFLLEQNKITTAMNNLNSDVLKEQMDYYKTSSQNIKMHVVNIIIQLLEQAGIEDTNFGTYFSNFENFIEVCENRCEVLFRQMCKEGNFSSKTPTEFRDAVIKNTVIIEGAVRDLLRRRFPQKEYIKGFNQFDSICNMIINSMKDCFEHARNVVIEKEERVLKAKACFEEQVSKTIGIKYSLDI